MFFNRNAESENDNMDYDEPMAEGREVGNESQKSFVYNPQAKINAMQKVINALNENIGSIKGQLAGYKALRYRYENLLREKIELEYKVKELGISVDQLNKALESAHQQRSEDSEMLGYALKMLPDFLEWYTKAKAQNVVNSYEAQIEVLKAQIATMKDCGHEIQK